MRPGIITGQAQNAVSRSQCVVVIFIGSLLAFSILAFA